MSKKIEEIYINDNGTSANNLLDIDYDIVRNKTFTNLSNSLKYYDASKVDLLSFKTGDGNTVRYFWFKHSNDYNENRNYNQTKAKPSSRSQLYANREPFEIEAWNQILIDESVVYGSKIDNNIEAFIQGDNNLEFETKLSVDNMIKQQLVWVDRSVMVCHPDGYTYGEIDEILYSPLNDTYYVGDTKTSSSVKKISYAYQLGVYIEILRLLNPDKNISPIGLINHVKVKNTKWVMNKSWEDDYRLKNGVMPPSIVEQTIIKNHPVYKAKWNDKVPIPQEITQGIIKFDVDLLQMVNLIKAEWYLIYTLLPKHGYYAHASALKNAVTYNQEIKKFNNDLQKKFNQLSEQF